MRPLAPVCRRSVLKDELGVSIATIRRDLTELEGRKLLRRTHGGAVSVTQVTHDNDTTIRETTNLEEKQRICCCRRDGG
ncbi:MAG: DeoR/GlpR transcriptional regulator [Betaproteobacteria bacterium]|nr:DeoR/GlpR transcriptional regulator [Betaproteobacteria bacterium]